jgi:signal transduction histidine kinase/DNA-binding response OmpR family regulator
VKIDITVLPPVYQTWYAYLFYLLLISGISIWVFRFYQSRLILRTSLEYERREKEQNELVNQSKLRFFTNISHEFRTPLTLILGQLEMLMQSSKIAPAFYKSIVNIHSNAQKLNQLINELLDFRKQEQGYKKLKVGEYNLVDFMQEIYLSFQEFARFHEIEFVFTKNKEYVLIWFDYLELQKVFNNLISNALKFTPKGGKIGIQLDANDQNVTISVSDSGIGISKENANKIFNIFYQAENVDSGSLPNMGTGIGLALAKGIVELHQGTIAVKSIPNQGSTFTVELQYGDSNFRNNTHAEIIDNQSDVLIIPNIDTSLDTDFIEELSENQNIYYKEKPTILIVEDNDSLRVMLIELFSTMYNTLNANNGRAGFKLAIEKHPDLIVSDVMMPEMDGNELCSKLKSNFETCHIPIVLLTAQTSMEQNIDGLKRGADDYITKPFNIRILVTRCNNLLIGRKILQEKYSKQIDNSAYNIASNELDRVFIEKATKVVEKNIDNEKLDVNLLCSELALGRRVFFYKMKSITGETPNDFIQNVRLKKAAWEIQNNPDKTICELSEELGYNGVSYFGKCFKKKFGLLPSEYKKNMALKCIQSQP